MTDSATVTREDAGKDIPVAKLAVASTIGTIIEAYDFVLYGTVAALVFDKLFFPDATPLVATLASFATFGVGFLARPVGGAIFGHYGDKVGRKKMLVLALVIMGVATMLIGALPGYNSIGIWAPILLVALRLIQGAALGGEWGGAVLMVTEYAPKGKRGFFGSWPQIGFAGGLAISTSIIWIMSTSLSDSAFESWGWRVPFFASGLLVAVGLYIRLKIEETPAFTELQQKHEREKAPAVEVIKEHPKNMLRAIGMRCSENITFYMLITFSLTYGEDTLKIDRNVLLAAIVICATISCFVIPFYGSADRPRRPPAGVPVGRARLDRVRARVLPAAAHRVGGDHHPRVHPRHEHCRTTCSTRPRRRTSPRCSRRASATAASRSARSSAACSPAPSRR